MYSEGRNGPVNRPGPPLSIGGFNIAHDPSRTCPRRSRHSRSLTLNGCAGTIGCVAFSGFVDRYKGAILPKGIGGFKSATVLILLLTLTMISLVNCTDSATEMVTSTPPPPITGTAIVGQITVPEPKISQEPSPTPERETTPKPVATEGPTAAPESTATLESTATPQPTTTPEPTATPQPMAASESTATPQPTATPEPTATPQPMATPKPTATPQPKVNVIDVGTHLVGTHIEPGIYMGLAGTGVLDSCYWERLSGLSGELSDTIANDNSIGPFYVEVSLSDVALSTRCELIELKGMPAPKEYLTQLLPGTYLVGRDIEPGIYAGKAGTEVRDTCYWERLSGLSGEFADTVANDNAKGLFYVDVSQTDVALSTRCELTDLDEVPGSQGFLTQLPPGTYLVGRDIQPGNYSGEAGTGVLDSCYWARLSGVSGEFSDLIANDNAQGRYFVQVGSTDFAVKFDCAVTKTN